MEVTILFLVVASLGAIYLWLRERSLLRRAFVGRTPLSQEEFHERYFQAMGVPSEISVGVISVLEEELGENLSCLEPSDDFAGNLSFLLERDGIVDVSIVEGLEKRFSVVISDAEAAAVHTVQEIVLLVATKVSALPHNHSLQARRP